jgi:hypothetical protein
MNLKIYVKIPIDNRSFSLRLSIFLLIIVLLRYICFLNFEAMFSINYSQDLNNGHGHNFKNQITIIIYAKVNLLLFHL